MEDTEEYEGREWHIDEFSGCGNSKSFQCDAWTLNDDGEKVMGIAHYHSDIEDGGDGEWFFLSIEYDEEDFDEENEEDDDEF